MDVESAKNARNRAMGGGSRRVSRSASASGVAINNLPLGIAIGTGLGDAIGAAFAGNKSG